VKTAQQLLAALSAVIVLAFRSFAFTNCKLHSKARRSKSAISERSNFIAVRQLTTCTIHVWLLVVFGTAFLLSCQRKNSPAEDQARDTPVLEAKEIFSRTSPSVYKLNVASVDGDFIVGSGFITILEGRKVLLTNRHVVENAAEVKIDGSDAEIDICKDIKIAKDLDLAVINVDGEEALTSIPMRSSPLEIGEDVYTIGYPHGLSKAISQGILNTEKDDLLVFSAAISNGNSGGPLLDNTGSVIGVITSTLSGEGGNVSQNYNIAIKTSKIPELTLFTSPKTHLFAAWKAATLAETSLHPVLKEVGDSAAYNNLMDMLLIVRFFDQLGASEDDIETDNTFKMLKQLSTDPQKMKKMGSISSKIYNTKLNSVFTKNIDLLSSALLVVADLKREIGTLNSNSHLMEQVASDTREIRYFDTSYDPNLASKMLGFSIDRFESDLKAQLEKYRILVEIMSREEEDMALLAKYVFRHKVSQLKDPTQEYLKSIAYGKYTDDEDSFPTFRKFRKPPKKIDFTRFRRTFTQNSSVELSKITTNTLIEILDNVDSPFPPLDLDYKSLKEADRSHAAMGDFLSTLVGMYDLLIIDLMQKGHIEDAEQLIALNDGNRPHCRAFTRRAELESLKGNYGAAEDQYEKMFLDLPARYDPFVFEQRGELGRQMLSMAFFGNMGERFSKYPSPYNRRMNEWDVYVKNMVAVPSSKQDIIFSEKNFNSYSEFQKFVIFYTHNGLDLDWEKFPAVEKFFTTISSYDDGVNGLESIQDDLTEFFSLLSQD